MKQLLLTFILIMPRAAYALDHSAKDMPDYALQVSFDVKASTIRGVATIPVMKGQELKLHIGCLSLIETSIDNHAVATSSGEEIVKILPSRADSLVIQYEGIFRELPHGEQPSDVRLSVVDTVICEIPPGWHSTHLVRGWGAMEQKVWLRYRKRRTCPAG